MYSFELENRTDSAKVTKTKNHLKETLLELMQDKKLEQITVVELTEKAGLNRTTFYRHYLDVYDLYEQIIEEYAETARRIFPSYFQKIWQGELTDLQDGLHSYWLEHRKKLQVLLLCDHQLVDRVKQENMAYVKSYLQVPEDDEEIDLIMEFYMTGTLGLILKCLQTESDIEIKKAMALQYEIVKTGLMEALNKRAVKE